VNAIRQQQCVEEVFMLVCNDLSMIADMPFKVLKVSSEPLQSRVAGGNSIHISYKLGFQHRGRLSHGCLLFPLADAITLASYLMLTPDDVVKSKRELTTLDPVLKDAMLEIGNFVAGAVDAAVRSNNIEGVRVHSEACQGVKPGVRPAFVYEEGSTLVIGRARLQLSTWPPFDALLMIPDFEAAPAAAA
jgi:hypothetical protein